MIGHQPFDFHVTRPLTDRRHRRPLKWVLGMFALAGMQVACSPTVIRTEGPVKPAASMLVLAGVPNLTDAQAEGFWLKVVKTYADGLGEALQQAGVSQTVHVRERHVLLADAMVNELAKAKKDAVITVTIEKVQTSTDNTVYLSAKLLLLEYRTLSDGTRKVVPRHGAEKRYPMFSTTQPDLRHTSLTGMAKELVGDWRQSGLIK